MSAPATRKITRPWGSWPSPISPADTAAAIRLSDVQWESEGAHIVWLEGRDGRGVLMADALDGNAPMELTPEQSVRAKVGYGGGEFTVHNGTVWFVENASGRIFRADIAGGPPRPVTPPFGQCAAPTVSPCGRWLLYIHSDGRHDCVAVVDAAGKHWPQRVAWKHDFVMQPCWSPDSQRVAWIAWDHPRMPWDGTVLIVADLAEAGQPGGPLVPHALERREIAGGEHVSIFQPAFAPDGRSILFVSDETGFGNLYQQDLKSGDRDAMTRLKAELNRPAWIQGLRSWGLSPDGKRAWLVVNDKGSYRLCCCRLSSRQLVEVPLADGYTRLSQPALHPTREMLAVVAGASTRPDRIITLDLQPVVNAIAGSPDSSGSGEARLASTDDASPTGTMAAAVAGTVRRRSGSERVLAGELSVAEPIEWQAGDGKPVHGLYYRPVNARYTSSGLPPAVLMIHGGPTTMRDTGYNASAQYLATRGFAVLEVNYRGSTGYGRPYMQALRGKWGVVDVEDAVSGAQHLVAQQLADGGRLVIMGGSAGGYTVLRALCQHPGTFRAGVVLYGVSDLFAIATDTHKFEERYIDSMVGPLPESAALYRERSPAFHAERIEDPVAIFQGSEDNVVPPDQSEKIVDVLRQRGVPHEYHVYEGEGHGWRRSETIATYWQAVERFLQRHVVYS